MPEDDVIIEDTETPIVEDIPPTYTTPETMATVIKAGTDPSLDNQANATKAGGDGELS